MHILQATEDIKAKRLGSKERQILIFSTLSFSLRTVSFASFCLKALYQNYCKCVASGMTIIFLFYA